MRSYGRILIALIMTVVISVSHCFALSGCGQDTPAALENAPADQTSGAGEASDVSASGQGEQPSETPTEDSSDEAKSSAGFVPTGGKPWIDSDLKENIRPDMELSPREDFHLCVNHDWLSKNDIPEGRTSISAFSEVLQETEKKAVSLLKEGRSTSHEADLVIDYYNAVLDWDARNEAGLEPVMDVVEAVRNVKDLDDMSDLICDSSKNFFLPCFQIFFNDKSYDDSERYVAYLDYDVLLLDDAAEYRNRTGMGDRYYDANKALTTALFTRLGYSADEAGKMFEDVIDLESRMAEAAYTREELLDPDIIQKVNNVFDLTELLKLQHNFPLRRYLESTGYSDSERFIVPQPEVIKRIDEFYTEDNLDAIRNYVLVKYVDSMAGYLDSAAYDSLMEAQNMADGSTGRQTDEIMAFTYVRSQLPNPMGKAFIEKYDAKEKKERIRKICEDVTDIYRDMLAGEEWLSEETRKKAIEKLDAIRISPVCPDKWIDYTSLDLKGLSALECRKAVMKFDRDRNIGLTNGSPDHDIWEVDFLEVNASYSPDENAIYIFLGILDKPFYYDGMSEEELLGGIGVVIGHEISHAFDTNGSQYDKDGNLKDWWTEEDYRAFRERARKLVQYYDGIVAFEGQNIPGNNIQSEAIADMAGVKCMLKLSKRDPSFDPAKFFEAYAAVWRRLNTPEAEYNMVLQNPHPLAYLRTNVTLQQYDEFLETYDIREGDNMYLAPEDRVLVW